MDTDAKTFDELSVEEVKLLLQQPLVVAVGECGLHFDHNFTSRKSALHAFRKQVNPAVEMDKSILFSCALLHWHKARGVGVH